MQTGKQILFHPAGCGQNKSENEQKEKMCHERLMQNFSPKLNDEHSWGEEASHSPTHGAGGRENPAMVVRRINFYVNLWVKCKALLDAGAMEKHRNGLSVDRRDVYELWTPQSAYRQ